MGAGGGVGGGEPIFMGTESQFEEMASSGDGGWGRLHDSVSALRAAELCA